MAKAGKRVLEKLTALEVERKRKAGRFSDGGGLYLQVGPTGGKSWLFRFMLNGKAQEMGLGALDACSLAKARKDAAVYREQLRERINPIDAREAVRTNEAVKSAKGKTFKDCAESYIKSHKDGWKNAKHATQWENTLTEYAYPAIGALPVSEVDTGEVMGILEPIWKDKTETASRVRGRIESVLNWAKVRGYRTGENPAQWRGHLDALLPERTKVAKVRHHPALPYAAIGAFMKALKAQEGIAARALETIILTATRTSEATNAQWAEIDLKHALWTIPGDRMKAGKPHTVPLSPRAVQILTELHKSKAGDFVFPGAKNDKPLSNMACLALLKRMERTDITVHGFRSTFRDWAAEQTAFAREVAEAALAHTIGDKVEAAYRRGNLIDKRRKMMEEWADYANKTASNQY